MKAIFIFIFFLFQINYVYANDNVVYLDVQFIIDNSDIGIFYKKKIKTTQDKIKSEIIKKEKTIKETEIDIESKKNILNKDELNKSLKNLEGLISEYRIYRNEKRKLVLNEKKKYSSKILQILNPILTEFVEKNGIDLVLDKKNILVGAKILDITNNLTLLLNEETKKLNLIDEN